MLGGFRKFSPRLVRHTLHSPFVLVRLHVSACELWSIVYIVWACLCRDALVDTCSEPIETFKLVGSTYTKQHFNGNTAT